MTIHRAFVSFSVTFHSKRVYDTATMSAERALSEGEFVLLLSERVTWAGLIRVAVGVAFFVWLSDFDLVFAINSAVSSFSSVFIVRVCSFLFSRVFVDLLFQLCSCHQGFDCIGFCCLLRFRTRQKSKHLELLETIVKKTFVIPPILSLILTL